SVPAQDVVDDDVRLVHGHVGERALAGDVTQRPDAGRGTHAVVHRDGAQPLVDPGRAGADRGEVSAPAGGHQQRLTGELRPAGQGDRETAGGGVGAADSGTPGTHRDAFPVEHPGAQTPGLRLLQRPQPARALAGRHPDAAPSATVTRLSNRAKTCASSTPIAPPPSTSSESGTRSASIALWLVQNGVPARPGIGGTAGLVPVAMTMPRCARSSCGAPSSRP